MLHVEPDLWGYIEQAAQGELVRFVAPEGFLRRDETHRSAGRGALE